MICENISFCCWLYYVNHVKIGFSKFRTRGRKLGNKQREWGGSGQPGGGECKQDGVLWV